MSSIRYVHSVSTLLNWTCHKRITMVIQLADGSFNNKGMSLPRFLQTAVDFQRREWETVRSYQTFRLILIALPDLEGHHRIEEVSSRGHPIASIDHALIFSSHWLTIYRFIYSLSWQKRCQRSGMTSNIAIHISKFTTVSFVLWCYSVNLPLSFVSTCFTPDTLYHDQNPSKIEIQDSMPSLPSLNDFALPSHHIPQRTFVRV